MQQGGSPSPFDRNFGTKMGVKVYKWILEKLSEERKITPADKDTACLLGKKIQIIHTVKSRVLMRPVLEHVSFITTPKMTDF
jgi:6-phosphofructokinase